MTFWMGRDAEAITIAGDMKASFFIRQWLMQRRLPSLLLSVSGWPRTLQRRKFIPVTRDRTGLMAFELDKEELTQWLAETFVDFSKAATLIGYQ